MAERATTLPLQAGLLAVTLASLPYKLFDLDRFFVPKELVLHVVALGLAVVLLRGARRAAVDTVDTLLAVFLLASAASALFATNRWLAQRALGLSVSSAVVFWAARRAGAASAHRRVLHVAATATVLGAATGLLQAYGVTSDFFSLNRAPGGTFGNRNFVAHFSAIGLPCVAYILLTARRTAGAAAAAIGVTTLATMLVLSRSRAAWLATLVALAVMGVAMLIGRARLAEVLPRRRMMRFAAAAAAGVVAAIALPNRLNWNSDSPYLESAIAVVDYTSGSGGGRVKQYVNSLRMTAAHPLLGVGPGNWPVRYVRYAPPNDPSLAGDGMTANPWPSSDWVAYLSERGPLAAVALAGALFLLFTRGLQGWRGSDGEGVLLRITLAATVAAIGVVSMFDAVLLLPATALLAWALVGTLAGVASRDVPPTPPRWWRWVAVGCVVLAAASVARSATQVVALSTVGRGGMRAAWLAAAPWDPGSFRIALRVAEIHADRGRCREAVPFARRARALFPQAAGPRRVLRRCGAR